MNSTKAEMLANVKDKVSFFKVPNFFYFTVDEYRQNKRVILEKVVTTFNSLVVVRSSSIFEDGVTVSSAGEFESVLDVDSTNNSKVHEAIMIVINSYNPHKENTSCKTNFG